MTTFTPPAPRRTTPAFKAGMVVLVAGSIAAILAALLLAFGGPARASNSPASSTGWPHPAAVAQVQRDLGQLNYYEGPIDGKIGPQTIDAIEYLQRDAKLPQTGQFTSATQAALANFMAHGNNQMGN
jgi:peptidoglycan hydrolase-like protein with peptidoglycan-binding domain